MSKTRWDRNRAARAQGAWDSDYFPLTGGLDRHSSGLTIKPGRMFQCLNFEEVFGYQGYRFVKGYERFDGNPNRPSRATYFVIPFTAGTQLVSMPAFDDVIDNGAGQSAHYVDIFVTSGTLAGGNAVGFVVFYVPSGDAAAQWSAGNPVKFSGNTFATCSADSYAGASTFTHDVSALTTLRTELRALITQPDGDGPILGGAVFQGKVYAVRNQVGNLTASMWVSSASGWVETITGLHPSTTYRFTQGNFTGDPTRLFLLMVNGKNRMVRFYFDGTSTYVPPIFGTEGQSTSNVTIGTGAKTFTIGEAGRTYTAGQDVTVWYPQDVSKWMRGTVTSYNSGTGALAINVTSTGGSGTYAQWEVGLSDFSDKPFLVTVHKNHVFLGYPGGQLQTSNLGDPMVYTTTASLFGLGQELTGLSSLKGKALAVFCERKIDVIEGSNSTDWDKQPYAGEYGAVLDTIVDNDGNPIFLSATGLTTLAATQNFGDVQAKTFSRDVQSILNEDRGSVVSARLALGNAQYRLYFEDGGCLRMTMLGGGGGAITEKVVSPGYSKYDTPPACVWQGMIDGEERMFFGGTDGRVYEEDAGTSFDGEEVTYALRLPFHHYKSPAVDKQFHKIEAEVASPDDIEISFWQIFDYDDGTFNLGSGAIDLPPPTGVFDVTPLDAGGIDRPSVQRIEQGVDGQGRNMALLFMVTSDFARPANLQGLLSYFSKLGVRP